MIPVGLSRDLACNEIAPVRHGGDAFVLWRDEGGILHAFEDRCPHRGVRLSLGFVRDNRLACLYHGWQFDGDGACRHIPAHPALKPPSTIRTRLFSVVERAGMIWLAREDEAPPATALLPAETRRVGIRSLAVEVGIATVRSVLSCDRAFWLERDGRLIAFHAPEPAISMLHLAIAPGEDRKEASSWLRHLRDALEDHASGRDAC